MFGIINLSAFLLAGILLNLTPGVDTMYILGRSIGQGRRAGVLSALGILSGGLVHTLAAALGLSVILAQSALAFSVVKYAGAVYLIYLGIKLIRSKVSSLQIEAVEGKSDDRKIFFEGMLTNILNPKVALFFLAFLPQFIDPTYSNPTLSFLLLGLIFMTTGTIWCLALAVFSARLSTTLTRNEKTHNWLEKITGGVFIYLGIKLALSEK